MTEPTGYYCPICQAEEGKKKNYSRYVCDSCAQKVTDFSGRSLIFNYIPERGGLKARYKDTNESYHDHVCYINGLRCYADESKYGSILIEVME